MQDGKLCPNLFTLSASSSLHTSRQDTAAFSVFFFTKTCFYLYWKITFKMAEKTVSVYMASVSGSLEMKKSQDRIFSVLSSKKIPFKAVDITQDSEYKDLMRKIAGNPTALPPQICNGDQYCGDFAAFENAVELNQLEQFLKL
uniref:SH3 domain-binding glutamic acid-rich-like protein 3 n=2 Tax=Cyprinodon variegatus TaxID=28743 RepID=A0A3Q2DA66_CYPVA